MYIFISHSTNEANIAGELCNAIENAKNRCFIAPRDIRSGHEYAEEIAMGIDRSDAVLLILSKAANKSPHVLREIERAVSKAIPILVYKVEEVELTKSMEYFLMTHQWMEAGKNTCQDVVKSVNNLKSRELDVESVAEVENEECDGSKKKNRFVTTAIVAVIALLIVIFAFSDGKKTGNSENNNRHFLVQEDVKLGDTIVMGSYNGEDIYWRVLKISEDRTEAVIVTRDVITVKAYDAAESGRFNHDGTENYYFDNEKLTDDMELQAYVQGNSNWETSNIRTWLNSSLENVKYEGQAPASEAMAEGVNGYNNEKGFLCSFTDEEMAIIKTTNVVTKGNALSDTSTIVTRDKVFLLSMDELAWFEEANVSLLAVPTPKAIENNKTYWYQDYCIDYGVENMMWWLREPVENSSSMCYLIGNGYYEENIYTWEVGVESFGIRPAMTIDLGAGE